MQERPIGENLDGTRGRVKIGKSLRTGRGRPNKSECSEYGSSRTQGRSKNERKGNGNNSVSKLDSLTPFNLYQNTPRVKAKLSLVNCKLGLNLLAEVGNR